MRHSSWPKKYRRVWQRTGARPGVILLEISRTAQQEGPETLADSGTIGDRIDGRIAGDRTAERQLTGSVYARINALLLGAPHVHTPLDGMVPGLFGPIVNPVRSKNLPSTLGRFV